MIKTSREIEDVYDFNDYASEMFNEFCDSLDTDGFTRAITEDDGIDPYEGFDRVYTDRGASLATRYLDRINAVGARHFNSSDLDVSSSLFQEP